MRRGVGAVHRAARSAGRARRAGVGPGAGAPVAGPGRAGAAWCTPARVSPEVPEVRPWPAIPSRRPFRGAPCDRRPRTRRAGATSPGWRPWPRPTPSLSCSSPCPAPGSAGTRPCTSARSPGTPPPPSSVPRAPGGSPTWSPRSPPSRPPSWPCGSPLPLWRRPPCCSRCGCGAGCCPSPCSPSPASCSPRCGPPCSTGPRRCPTSGWPSRRSSPSAASCAPRPTAGTAGPSPGRAPLWHSPR